jgi:minor histocompatibility antigen H13
MSDPATAATGDAPKIDDANVLLNVYVPLLIVATSIIYYAAKRSLDQKEMEAMSTKDAMMFPVVGSCVLFGLFLLFKFFAKEYLNLLFTFYFLILGLASVAMTLLPAVEKVTGAAKKDDKPLIKFDIKIPYFNDGVEGSEHEKTEIEMTGNDLVCYIFGAIIAVWYGATKHWLANDILGVSFCIQAIEMMSLGSYKNGIILLCGLFFYDIFWVFGTGFFMEEGNSVMVSVAKNFDAPIKLLFPKHYPPQEKQFSMLGLGDIVIPGIFVALCCRYDARQGKDTSIFQYALGGYILGLGTTVFVMHVFQAAQPALLYIVPACIATSAAGAMAKGKFADLWAYTEESEEEGDGEKKGEDKAEDKKAK